MPDTGPPASFDDLESRVTEWAAARGDIRAAIVVGSRAREDRPADEWADLDVGFVVKRPARYLSDVRWLAEIASPLVSYRDSAGPTIHVLFEGGLDVGLAFLPYSAFKSALRFIAPIKRRPGVQRALPFGLGTRIDSLIAEGAAYYGRGYRVLVDKDGLVARFMAEFPAPAVRVEPPSKDDFSQTVNEFWFSAVWIAKHLRRGEHWWTIEGGWNHHMRPLMLRMIEWHACSERGWSFDVWSDGRFLEEWADPGIVECLRDALPRYDGEAIWSALLASMESFRSIANETARRLGFDYASGADEGVTALVRRLFEERGEGKS
jgi:aminoglycoside 6-adenylyltransferase